MSQQQVSKKHKINSKMSKKAAAIVRLWDSDKHLLMTKQAEMSQPRHSWKRSLNKFCVTVS